jgi:hypothetical protein
MAGRDEGTGALIEPRNNRACRRLAVTIIRRLQSFTQWWVRLNKPHTQKFGHSHCVTYLNVARWKSAAAFAEAFSPQTMQDPAFEVSDRLRIVLDVV